MEKTDIPQSLNSVLAFAIGGLVLTQSLILPVWFAGHPYWMALIVILLIPLNTPLWSLIHEAVHKNFHSNKMVNEFAGRTMSILFGASFQILRFGHLMHHQYNRDWESEFIKPEQNKILAWFNHYFKMLGGLYLSEIALTFVSALAPLSLQRKIARKLFNDDAHYQAVLNSILKPSNVTKIRIDAVCIVLFFSVSFYLFGDNWPVLVLFIAGRGLFISLMDNAYHYGTPEDNSVVAKELRVPNLFSRFILHFNHHVTHHNNTRLSWTQLPEGRVQQNNDYAEGLWSAILKQFKGPIKS